jgi:hypothetical protein
MGDDVPRAGFPPGQIFLEMPSNAACFFRRLGAGYLAGLFSRAGWFRGLGLVAGDVFTLGVAVEDPKNAVRAFSNESCVIAFADFISAS